MSKTVRNRALSVVKNTHICVILRGSAFLTPKKSGHFGQPSQLGNEPFAYHMLPDMRCLIDRVAAQLEPRQNDIRGRLLFVQMWVGELETEVS